MGSSRDNDGEACVFKGGSVIRSGTILRGRKGKGESLFGGGPRRLEESQSSWSRLPNVPSFSYFSYFHYQVCGAKESGYFWKPLRKAVNALTRRSAIRLDWCTLPSVPCRFRSWVARSSWLDPRSTYETREKTLCLALTVFPLNLVSIEPCWRDAVDKNATSFSSVFHRLFHSRIFHMEMLEQIGRTH